MSTKTRFPTTMMPPEEHEPNLDSMPELDLQSAARTTRKTLERLAPFAKMRPSTGTSALVNKIVEKINAYIELVDMSMHASQLGYQLARDVVVASDPVEKAAGWDADFEVASNVGSEYRPSRPNSPPPLNVPSSPPAGASSVAELAVQGYEMAMEVEQGFNNISQALYKIAAATKESKLVVAVPPDPTHTETLKLNLKDVATDLVANLSLLSEFAQKASRMAEWWTWARNEFAPESTSNHGSVEGEASGGVLAPGAILTAAPMELTDSVSTDWEDLKGEETAQEGWKANLKRRMTASKDNLAISSSRKRSSTMRSTMAASRPAARRMNTAEIQRDAAKFAKWRQVQHNFEQYYRIINSSHGRYPDLLPTSNTAWETVAPLIPLQNVDEEQGEGGSSGYLTPPQQAQSMIHFDPESEGAQLRNRNTRRQSRLSQTSVQSAQLLIFGSKQMGITLRGRSGVLSYVEQKEIRKRELNRKSVLWIEEEKKKEKDNDLLDDADSRRRRSGVTAAVEKDRDEHAVPLLRETQELPEGLLNDDVLTKKTRWCCC